MPNGVRLRLSHGVDLKVLRGLLAALELLDLRIHVFELRIAVRMRGAFLGLAVRLQAVFLFVQQFGHEHVTHRVSLGPQFSGEIPHAFTGPPQRGLRIPPASEVKPS